MKQKINMNEKTQKSQIKYMLLPGKHLTMLIDTLTTHSRMIRLIDK
jgi:hypothetical protein